MKNLLLPRFATAASRLAALPIFALAACGSVSEPSSDPPAAAASSAAPTPAPPTTTTAPSPTHAPPPGPAPYVPKGLDLRSGTVVDFRFADEKTGFLLVDYGDGSVPGAAWVTADGGDSWTKREIDLVPTGLAFNADRSALWFVGYGSSSSDLWRSVDRGATFKPVIPSPLGLDTAGDLAFVDAKTVVVASWSGDDVRRTTDGGATWTTQAFSRDVFAGNTRVSVSGRDVWLAGGHIGAGGAHVAHSTDAGATWTTRQLDDGANLYEGGSLSAVRAVSGSDVWVAGDSRQLFHTKDGGTTWTQTEAVSDVIDSFGGIDVRGSRVTLAGVGRGGYAIYESNDGGATFKVTDTMACPGICNAVHGIASPSPRVLFVYGDYGLFWRLERASP